MSIDHDLVYQRAQQRVGKVVRNKYRLDQLLGVGGMGCVFAATHRNGGAVALKILHPEFATVEAVRTRFLREGYVANRIAHPSVLKVIDDDDDDDGKSVFLVMELLSGETLEAKWERNGKRLGLDDVLTHVDVVLDVLVTAHSRGVIHRDLKPDNLFLTDNGELKVLDFGIARLLDGTGATRSGQILGTPAFMAPEQAGGRVREVDGRTDLWSLGAVAFTLLSGESVHAASTPAQQMIYAATQNARKLRTLASWVPAQVADVIDRALAFERADRWQSAEAMRAALPLSKRASVTPAATKAAPASSPIPKVSAPTIIQGSGSDSSE